MRQERPDVDVPFGDPAILLPRVMNNGHQAVAVPADIEDHISLHGIGILEDLPHFHEVPPPRALALLYRKAVRRLAEQDVKSFVDVLQVPWEPHKGRNSVAQGVALGKAPSPALTGTLSPVGPVGGEGRGEGERRSNPGLAPWAMLCRPFGPASV